MTQLLISVTSIEEAKLALENGADIIDLKDPGVGALGALPLKKIQTIVAYIGGKKQTSATIGDWPMEASLIVDKIRLVASTEVDFIKIGFFETDDYSACLSAMQSLTLEGIKLVAVWFAEIEYPMDLIKQIKGAGFIGIMLDTAIKNGATFLDHYTEKQRIVFARKIKKEGLLMGVAGSLKLEQITLALQLNPTYIGFRGGVCSSNKRTLGIESKKIFEIRQRLDVLDANLQKNNCNQ